VALRILGRIRKKGGAAAKRGQKGWGRWIGLLMGSWAVQSKVRIGVKKKPMSPGQKMNGFRRGGSRVTFIGIRKRRRRT